MNCPYCNSKLPAHKTLFCPICKNKLDKATPSSERTPRPISTPSSSPKPVVRPIPSGLNPFEEAEAIMNNREAGEAFSGGGASAGQVALPVTETATAPTPTSTTQATSDVVDNTVVKEKEEEMAHSSDNFESKQEEVKPESKVVVEPDGGQPNASKTESGEPEGSSTNEGDLATQEEVPSSRGLFADLEKEMLSDEDDGGSNDRDLFEDTEPDEYEEDPDDKKKSIFQRHKEKKQRRNEHREINRNGLTRKEAAYIAANRDKFYDPILPIDYEEVVSSPFLTLVKVLAAVLFVVLIALLLLFFL